MPPPRSHGSEKRRLLSVFALGLLALLAYSNSFTTGFALDARQLILGDPRIRQFTAENLGLIFRHTYWWPNGEAGLYRPFTTFSYLFNYAILGNRSSPAGYHWINFVLHAGNVVLLFLLLKPSRKAFLGAALWAVHPVLTESVTNVAGRADLLAAMAVLGGILIYRRAAESSGTRRVFWLLLLGLITLAGAFSKESAVVLPGLLLLYEWLAGRRNWRAALTACGVTAIPIAGMLLARGYVLAHSPPAEFPFVDNPIVSAGFWAGRIAAIEVLGRYLWIAVWPDRLSSDYSYAQIPGFHGTATDWLCIATVALAVVVAILMLRRSRTAFFFFCFAFLTLLPASNLLFPIGAIMAERLLYLPLAGLIAAIVIGTQPSRTPVAVAVCAIIVVTFAARTWWRNRDWTDDLTMATTTVRTSPNSFKSHRLLAAALFPDNVDRAVTEAGRSVAILESVPDSQSIPGPWNLDATCHLGKGDKLSGVDARREYEKAAKLALRAIAIDAASRAAYERRNKIRLPDPPTAASNNRLLASVYLRLGNSAGALPLAIKAQAIDPSDPDVYREIADAYMAEGSGEKAAIALAQGAFLTGDQTLRNDLLKLYQAGVDTSGCAVVPGPRGPALNPDCDIVRRNLCEAAARANRDDLRAQIGCPK